MWHVSKSYFKSSIDVNYKGALLINLIKVWQKATFRSKSCFEINNFEFYHFWHEKFKHSRLLTSKIPKFWLFWKENYEDLPIMIFDILNKKSNYSTVCLLMENMNVTFVPEYVEMTNPSHPRFVLILLGRMYVLTCS